MSCLGKDISHIPLTLVTALSRVLQPATRLASSPCSASTSSSITAVTRLVPAPRLWKYFYSVTNIFNVTFAAAGLQIRLIVCSSELGAVSGQKMKYLPLYIFSDHYQTVAGRRHALHGLCGVSHRYTDNSIDGKKILTRGFFGRYLQRKLCQG